MLGMTSMLLRVLFSRKPTVLRNWCLEKKKKEKTVFDTRCRCEKCVEKRKKTKNEKKPTKEQLNELGETNKGFIELETLKNRKITFKEQQDRGEEIILQVPRLASEHQKH